MNNRLNTLKEIRQFFSNKNNWCKGWFSKLKEDGTYSYCILGAINRCVDSYENSKLIKSKLRQTMNEIYPEYTLAGLDILNDYLGYEAVINVLDKAIENNS